MWLAKTAKTVMADVKLIYRAVNKELAEEHLNALEEKWGKKYPIIIKSWRNNWHKLSTFFKYADRYTPANLYYQYDRGFSSANQKSNQNKRSIYK